MATLQKKSRYISFFKFFAYHFKNNVCRCRDCIYSHGFKLMSLHKANNAKKSNTLNAASNVKYVDFSVRNLKTLQNVPYPGV